MGKVRVIELGFSKEERHKEIDEHTKQKIREDYALEDEIKILRRTIKALADALGITLPTEFAEYNSIVEQIVTTNKTKKANIRGTAIKTKRNERRDKRCKI